MNWGVTAHLHKPTQLKLSFRPRAGPIHELDECVTHLDEPHPHPTGEYSRYWKFSRSKSFPHCLNFFTSPRENWKLEVNRLQIFTILSINHLPLTLCWLMS